MPRASDLMAGIRMGDVAVSLVVTSTPYSPDVADDLARRTLDLWHGALGGLDDYGLLDNDSDDENDEPVAGMSVVQMLEEWGDDLA